jgi:hypothetical protein
MTYAMLVSALNDNFAQIENLNVTIVLKDDRGINRVLQGRAPDGSYGEKVSKPTIDVTKADDSQLVTKDDYATKIWYDDANARIIQGLLPDGTYGMVISKPGVDVLTVFS